MANVFEQELVRLAHEYLICNLNDEEYHEALHLLACEAQVKNQ